MCAPLRYHHNTPDLFYLWVIRRTYSVQVTGDLQNNTYHKNLLWRKTVNVENERQDFPLSWRERVALTLSLPGVIKTLFLPTISIQHQASRYWEYQYISTRGLSVYLTPPSQNNMYRKCMAKSKENFHLDIGSEGANERLLMMMTSDCSSRLLRSKSSFKLNNSLPVSLNPKSQ